jgi:hypothetical protein
MYSKYWRQLRTWTYASWGVLVSGLAVELLISQSRLESISTYFMWFWLIAFGYTRLVVVFFRCPRCEKLFFVVKGRGFNTFTRTCRHCGLQKWAPNPR